MLAKTNQRSRRNMAVSQNKLWIIIKKFCDIVVNMHIKRMCFMRIEHESGL